MTEADRTPAPSAALPASERIVTLDIVRGVALLGILVMNLPGFAHSIFASPDGAPVRTLDAVAALLRDELFGGKFNIMFSMLFGIGFTIQLGRLEAREPRRATAIYVRRLVVLLAVGLVHAGLLWAGDVLLVYAALGFTLLLLRRAPDRAVVALIVGCVLYPAVSEWLRPFVLGPRAEALAAFEYEDFEASNDAAFGRGSFADAARETARMLAWGYTTPLGAWSVAAFYVQMATGLFIGWWIGRRGLASRLDAIAPRLGGAIWAALAVGVAGAVVHAAGRDVLQQGEPAWQAAAVTLAHTLSRVGWMLFYALVLVRLAQTPRGRRWLAPFASAGRMPLTNYLMQTAIGLCLFYGWGLGLWGRTGPAVELALAFGIFVLVQLPLSVWWLRRFRYGPLEYAWRTLTYGRRPL